MIAGETLGRGGADGAAAAALRKVRIVPQVLVGGEIPVLGEDALQAGDGGALQPHFRVAPEAKAGHLAQVLVADIQAAREGDPAIHDQDLAVVAQVDLDAAANRIEREEDTTFPASRDERLQPASAEAMRAHGVVEEPNFHSFACLRRQQVEELLARGVRLKDEILKMNMMFGFADRLQLVGVGRLAFVVKDDLASRLDGKSAEASATRRATSSQPASVLRRVSRATRLGRRAAGFDS